MRNEPARLEPNPYYQHSVHRLLRNGLARLSMRFRRHAFAAFMREVQPTEQHTVLDVGVTGAVDMAESNTVEQLYPFPGRLIGMGLEDLSAVHRAFPNSSFVRGDALRLPFADSSFDIVVAFAVIEHLGSRARQACFVREALRVGGLCYLTTPHRYFPLELHTFLPMLHYLPAQHYRRVLNALGYGFYAQEAHLNLLTTVEVRALFPPESSVRTMTTPIGTHIVAMARRPFVHRSRGGLAVAKGDTR